MVSLEMLRSHARALMWLVTIPFAGMVVIVAALVTGQVWSGGRQLASVLIYYTPMALYMWAIWMVRQSLRAIARGDLFHQVIPALLARVGLALFGGAVFTVFGVPLLTWLMQGRALIQTFEPSPVTLGVIGAALVLLAQLLRRAADEREELQGFF